MECGAREHERSDTAAAAATRTQFTMAPITPEQQERSDKNRAAAVEIRATRAAQAALGRLAQQAPALPTQPQVLCAPPCSLNHLQPCICLPAAPDFALGAVLQSAIKRAAQTALGRQAQQASALPTQPQVLCAPPCSLNHLQPCISLPAASDFALALSCRAL